MFNRIFREESVLIYLKSFGTNFGRHKNVRKFGHFLLIFFYRSGSIFGGGGDSESRMTTFYFMSMGIRDLAVSCIFFPEPWVAQSLSDSQIVESVVSIKKLRTRAADELRPVGLERTVHSRLFFIGHSVLLFLFTNFGFLMLSHFFSAHCTMDRSVYRVFFHFQKT